MENSNVEKTNYGYNLIWHNAKNYGAKILVFEKPSNTDFVFHLATEKTWFVNSGVFIFKWIDTTSGNIFQQEFFEGNVFTAITTTPYSIECKSSSGSLSEVNTGFVEKDIFTVIKKEILS